MRNKNVSVILIKDFPFKLNGRWGSFSDYMIIHGDGSVTDLKGHNYDNAKAIDVVLCRDCKYFLKPHACLSEDGMVTAQEDGFCSYGEQKNDVPANIIESLKKEINTVNRLNDRIKNRGNNV